jgi:hypothetical protein
MPVIQDFSDLKPGLRVIISISLFIINSNSNFVVSVLGDSLIQKEGL